MDMDRQRELLAILRQRAARRRTLLASASDELRAIAELVPECLAAGLTKQAIAQATGLSRPTIDAKLKQLAGDPAEATSTTGPPGTDHMRRSRRPGAPDGPDTFS